MSGIIAKLDTTKLDEIIKTLPGNRNEIVRKAAYHILGNSRAKAPHVTGWLKDHSDVTNSGDSASVNFYAEYAPYVEMGTKYMYARPFLYTSVETERQNFIEQLKKDLVK